MPHLVSPLRALRLLLLSILFLTNLKVVFLFFLTCSPPHFFHSALCSDCIRLTLLTSLSPHFWLSVPSSPRLPAFLRQSPNGMSTVYSFSLTRFISASSPQCSIEHFSFLCPPFSSFLRTPIHSSVWFKLQEYFLLFPLKGRWISFHEAGKEERWAEFENSKEWWRGAEEKIGWCLESNKNLGNLVHWPERRDMQAE